MHFLNGRFSEDSHGSTTCIANKGFSVVDYMRADSAFFEYVKKLSVMKRDESDHFPLACVIKTSIASHHELEDEIISDLQPKKYKFDASTGVLQKSSTVSSTMEFRTKGIFSKIIKD